MLMSAYKEDADNLNLIDVASRTFTPETLTGCQNLDTFQKSTYVERNPLYGHPLDTDNSLLWTVCFVPWKRKPLHFL